MYDILKTIKNGKKANKELEDWILMFYLAKKNKEDEKFKHFQKLFIDDDYKFLKNGIVFINRGVKKPIKTTIKETKDEYIIESVVLI